MTPRRPNLVLIGMMGAGKTTIGRHVARRLGCPFVDTDQVVEVEAGMSVAEIFARRGEEAFRDLEAAVVERVAAVGGQVIAVGGGAVLRDGNLTVLRDNGCVVLLDAPVARLAGRVSEGRARGARPLLTGDGADVGHGDVGGSDAVDDAEATLARLHALWREREARYTTAAHHRVASGFRPPPVIADEIVAWWRDRCAGVAT